MTPDTTCGMCSFCHEVQHPAKSKTHQKIEWCFVEPPYAMYGDDGAFMSERGALTNANAPSCKDFQPRLKH